MSKLKNQLQKHLFGEVLESPEVLEHFSTDGSIFRLTPEVVVYPRSTADVRKLARISWLLAEQGKQLPLTARGYGSNPTGAALGSGAVVVFPPYMWRLLELSDDSVTVEPGLLYRDLQNTLMSHGRFLPPYPASLDFSSIGGAVANNTSGLKSVKYGATRDYVQSLEVVLANGQRIVTGRLSAKAVDNKKGQTDLEGEIYRKLDGLLADKAALLEKQRPKTRRNAAGYQLWDVRHSDGSLDLTPLIVGSQGTLGIVTKITLKTEPYQPQTQLLAVACDDFERMTQAVSQLLELTPSTLEFLDGNLLRRIQKHDPYRLEGLVPAELPKGLLLVEFDDKNSKTQAKKIKKAQKALVDLVSDIRVITEPAKQEKYWRLYQGIATVVAPQSGPKRPLPIIEDAVVPLAKTAEFLKKASQLFKQHHLDIAVWGHAGDGNFQLRPALDLANVGDRQTVFTLMDDFYELVIALGGSPTGQHGDGRLRAPYLTQLYGEEMVELFGAVKSAFDPHGILNPAVKTGVSQEDLKGLLRQKYSSPRPFTAPPAV